MRRMAPSTASTGERADQGTGWGKNTGGGWINGRGDAEMTMLVGYGHMVDFFTRLPWWMLEPRPDLTSTKVVRCLADPGRVYVIYLPAGGRARVRMEPGRYAAIWFNPRTGPTSALTAATGSDWTSPEAPDAGDWALLLRREGR